MSNHDQSPGMVGGYWFAKYAAFYVLPVLILIPIFFEHDGWFIGLATYWFLAVAFLAWRSMSQLVSVFWRICLAVVMLVSCSYSIAFVLATPGDTDVCYDRLIAPTRGSLGFNLGPSPNCEGTPLQDVQID